MRNTRKRYTASEKAKIALDAIKGSMTMAEIVAKYAVHATQVNKWKKQLLQKLPEIFLDKNAQQAAVHESEMTRLYEQIGRLKVENEFLKKKSELFT